MSAMWSVCRLLLTESLMSANNTVSNETAGKVEGTRKTLKRGSGGRAQ